MGLGRGRLAVAGPPVCPAFQVVSEAAGDRWVNTDHVFTTKIGTMIEPGNLRRTWEPLRRADGLDDVVFHGLRHTFACRLPVWTSACRRTSSAR